MARGACGGAAGSVARVSVSRGDASDRRPARVGVHKDQTILVAAQEAGGFSMRTVISGPGTLMNQESLSGRECEGCGQRKRRI